MPVALDASRILPDQCRAQLMMAVSTDSIAPCNEPSPQPYTPTSVDILTNSQLHQLIQYLKVSIFVIRIINLR